MRYYRCLVCAPQPDGFEFAGGPAGGVCPRCGARFPGVVELTPVHFLAIDRDGPLWMRSCPENPSGRYRLACRPELRTLARGHNDAIPASDFPPAVTCPACRKHPALGALLEQFGLDPADPRQAGGLRIEGECC